MKITWIGQAGLLIRADGLTIMIDPYLSDSVGAQNPKMYRRVPVDESLFEITPDVLLFTHNHLDHYDPETAERFLAKKDRIVVLSPTGSWQLARVNGGAHNYVLFDKGTEWTQGNVRFIAVPAVHSDEHAIGVIIEAEGRRLYVTGDTLYSRNILSALPDGIDDLFLPINGAGNNMNMTDAARFAKETGAKHVYPMHWGLMDELTPDAFAADNKVVMEIYKEMTPED